MTKFKKVISFVLMVVLFFGLFSSNMLIPARAADLEIVLYDKYIGKGITYSDKQLQSFTSKLKQRVNIVTADLNEKDVNIIFSKAKDTVKKTDTLTQQIQREIFKGNNVVAGINADMFNMSTGFSTGPQVKDGAIIAAHNTRSEEKIYPVFGIDKSKKAFIDNIYLNAKLTTGNGSSTDIDNINRMPAKNTLVINTYQLNESRKLDFSSFASTGALTIVRGIPSQIMLGQEYEGTVETIGEGNKEILLEEDFIVLASNGTKTDWVKANIKSGDKIKIKIDYNRPGIQEVLGGYSYLIKAGRVLTSQEMIKAGASSSLVTARKSRTAVGITADNRVIAITSDGGTPSKGVSDGVTLAEMAQIMKDNGAIYAMSLDGGGSTQMNVKLNGENNLRIVNRPSDGGQRAVTNGILFVSTSDRSSKVGNIHVEKNIVIYKNSQFKFRITGTDSNYNPINLYNANVKWTVDSKLGTIDTTGLFTSGSKMTYGNINAEWSGAKGQGTIYVVDDVDTIGINEGTTEIMQYGNIKQLSLNATAFGGQPVIIMNSLASWSLKGNIGTIDKNGVIKITAKKGVGEVTAQLGAKKATLKINVEDAKFVVDSFEHLDNSRYSVSGSIGGMGTITNEKAISGKYSYRVIYDYDKSWARDGNGTINLIHGLNDKAGNDIAETFMSTLLPKKIGMWVYGDGKAPWLRAVITDGDGNNQTLNLASRVNWTGWKYVDADMPRDIALPVSLNYIYLAETNKALHYKGAIYFDDIRFTYSDSDDLKEPEVSGFLPATIQFTKDINISLSLSDLKTGVNAKTIKARLDGKEIKVSFDTKTGKLIYSAKGLADGIHSFELEASDNAGNKLNPIFKKSFIVSLKPDKDKPVISKLMPGYNMVVDTATPRISVNIKDSQSGVASKDISISLDNQKLEHYYDESSGWAYAITNGAIASGEHTIKVQATDKAGNICDEVNSVFSVTPLKGPKDSEAFTISVTSDTHGTVFGEEIFRAINKEESELVIQNGDVVDEDDPVEWAEAVRQLVLVGNKDLVLSPGNHEVSNSSLEAYSKNLGVAQYSYSFEYGNSLFISLNSALSQSISASDPTQFDYLQKLLARNTRKNIFIYTHVPTRDSYGTAHQMLKSDADRLEKILGDYKAANPSNNINVLFGNLHVNQSWIVNGVNYIITGNGSMKKYVAADNGGFLSYTKIAVNGSQVSYKFVPLVSKIAVMDPALKAGEMKIIKGTSKAINLYGDFTIQSANYIINLSKFQNLGIAWYSDNPSAIAVSSTGVLTARGEGSANIKANLGEKSYTFKATTVDSKSVTPVSILTNSGSIKLEGGQSLELKTIAYDMYGNTYEVDKSLIRYTYDKVIGSVSGGILTSTSSGKAASGYIITSYLNCTSKTLVNVAAKKVYATVTAKTLNVRETPASNGKILGTLKANDKIEVLGDTNGWLKISFSGKIAYILKQYTK